jgi:hypothetical protein
MHLPQRDCSYGVWLLDFLHGKSSYEHMQGHALMNTPSAVLDLNAFERSGNRASSTPRRLRSESFRALIRAAPIAALLLLALAPLVLIFIARFLIELMLADVKN